MQLHQITSSNLNRNRKRVGRGGKRGTYSGHGGKGQTGRSGRKLRPIVRDILKRYPKLRGYRNRPVSQEIQTVDLAKIEKNFSQGQTVTPAVLVQKNLASRQGGKTPLLKIMGSGKFTKKINLIGCVVSKSAKEKIEKAGGTIKE